MGQPCAAAAPAQPKQLHTGPWHLDSLQTAAWKRSPSSLLAHLFPGSGPSFGVKKVCWASAGNERLHYHLSPWNSGGCWRKERLWWQRARIGWAHCLPWWSPQKTYRNSSGSLGPAQPLIHHAKYFFFALLLPFPHANGNNSLHKPAGSSFWRGGDHGLLCKVLHPGSVCAAGSRRVLQEPGICILAAAACHGQGTASLLLWEKKR